MPKRKSKLTYSKWNCGNPYVCAYCGILAEDEDHVIPTSYVNKLSFFDMTALKDCLIIVPSCKECNNLAGNKVFNSFIEKREYIQNKIKNIYLDIIKFPEWEDEEINDLSGSTLIDLKISILKKKIILERINFSAVIIPSSNNNFLDRESEIDYEKERQRQIFD